MTLTGVNGDSGTLASAAVTFGQLAGDVNGDGTVDGTDLQSVRMNSGRGLVTDANFRNDVSGDGKVNHADISLTRAARRQLAAVSRMKAHRRGTSRIKSAPRRDGCKQTRQS